MTTNFCPFCGNQNAAQARFCASCGKQLPSQSLPPQGSGTNCPKCNMPLRPGAKFCPNCGYTVPQAAGVAPAAAPPPAPPPAPAMPPSRTPGGATQLMREDAGEAPTLVVRWMGGNTEQFAITKPIISVGRAPGNDVVINHPAVSGRHLSLAIPPAPKGAPVQYQITDLGSTNGTLVNGQRIQPNVASLLNPNDAVRIGDLTGNWVGISLQVAGVEPVRSLALGKLDLSGQAHILIGRDPSSYLPLNHPTVSTRHAEIYKQNDGSLVIRDLGSTNGTFVNGQRVSQVPLKSGDVIQIGPFKLNYDAQGQSLAQSMRLGHRIDALKLGREVANKRMILTDVTMTINAGEFVALVGGSGAGKSTLMKAMNGYEPANHGNILLDGEPLYARLDLYRTHMGYVPQDDIIHRALPVKLALWYAAKLRLPDAKPAEIEARIQDALRAVDMTEHANKPVRVLSGGQRKRVSIAVELLARPTLFFLDEPTSGLDPGLEKKMMYDLNRLAGEGRTVVLVTHATANIEQCDHVAFMSYGRLAYYGPPSDALKFYNVRDFSDIYLKISQEIDPAKGKPVPSELTPYYNPSRGKVISGILWADHYRQSPYYQKYVVDRQASLAGGAAGKASMGAAPPPRRSRDNFLRQTVILARRQFDLIRLDLRTLFILLLMMPLIGALFMMVGKPKAFVGEGDKAAMERKLKNDLSGAAEGAKEDYTPAADAQILVTMLGLALTQGGTFGAAYEIVKERAIFRRERAVNLSVIAYVLSKVLILAVFAVIQAFSVLLVLSLKIDLSFKGAVFDSGFLEMFVTLYLGVLASILFGLCLSALVPSSDVVLYAILVQLFVQIVLGGTLFPLKDAMNEDVAASLSKVTVSYWVMDAMGSTIDMVALNDSSIACKVSPDPTAGYALAPQCSTADIKLYLDYEHTPEHVIAMWIGLLVHCAVWFLLTTILVARQKGE
jgi:ABC-type multidrug transport system ATPase subunit/pSer/pThr/pTyr-binding forkhead associated (FHA) protein/ABC-type multidrug transport system permease subunit